MARGKGWNMKRKLLIAVPALILASSFLATPAIADTKPPAPAEANDARVIYKLAQDKFLSELRVYEDKRRAINQSFKEAIEMVAKKMGISPKVVMTILEHEYENVNKRTK